MPQHDPSATACSWPPGAAERPAHWCVVAASVRGVSHQKTGQPCQDAHCWRIAGDRILIAAIADGAGTASLGDVGAMLGACTAVVAVNTHQQKQGWPQDDEAWRHCLSEAMQAARAALATEARARQVAMHALATTLILVVATPELVAAAQIGDGAAVVEDVDGNMISLTVPQYGEYVNETTFLISPQALDTAQLQVWHGTPACIAAFSDGLQQLALAMPDRTPHRPFFRPLFHFVTTVSELLKAQEQMEDFLRSPRVTARTNDDTTLLLAALVR